jgi:hypothetical protein
MGSESFGVRKYFLDWLRAAAFGALILFHAGMPYVTWDYGIKSERIYPQLEMVMSAVGAWRLALLFFIAGVASRFLLEKCGPGSYAVARIRRLFVVVLVAVVFIIPVQVYVEFLRKGWIAPGYFKFWLVHLSVPWTSITRWRRSAYILPYMTSSERLTEPIHG